MSEKPKWTPGPWKVSKTYNPGSIHVHAHGLVAACDAGDYARSREEGYANARLIASAPALYEALEELVAKCPACGGEGVEYGPDPGESFGPNRGVLDVPCRWCADARSVLARARGETP